MWWNSVKGWLYAKPDGGSVYFSREVVEVMLSHRQLKSRNKEAGGVLLGRHLLDCNDIVVDEVTQPARGDRRSWAGFFRSLAHHTRSLRRWRESGGTCAYLGSWHTHPEDVPNPSSIDLDDWQHALARDRFEGESLFFAIVGTSRARVWQGNRDGSVKELVLTKEI
jgi:integrative and conjugative element protein (TIGR02256 family)